MPSTPCKIKRPHRWKLNEIADVVNYIPIHTRILQYKSSLRRHLKSLSDQVGHGEFSGAVEKLVTSLLRSAVAAEIKFCHPQFVLGDHNSLATIISNYPKIPTHRYD